MKALQSIPLQDEFENALLTELEELRRAEKALEKMYTRLKGKPQLRTQFLEQLADMQLRTERLDAVLDPVEALQFQPSFYAGPLPVAS
jgi:ferritin-like metal-binding protein YciE